MSSMTVVPTPWASQSDQHEFFTRLAAALQLLHAETARLSIVPASDLVRTLTDSPSWAEEQIARMRDAFESVETQMYAALDVLVPAQLEAEAARLRTALGKVEERLRVSKEREQRLPRGQSEERAERAARRREQEQALGAAYRAVTALEQKITA